MNSQSNSVSAVEVIRWVYIARELQRRGYEDAAELWYAKASQWLAQTVSESEKMIAGEEGGKVGSRPADHG